MPKNGRWIDDETADLGTALNAAVSQETVRDLFALHYIVLPLKWKWEESPATIEATLNLTRGMLAAIYEFQRNILCGKPVRVCINSGAINLNHAMMRFAALSDLFANRKHAHRFVLRKLHSTAPTFCGEIITSFAEHAWDRMGTIELRVRNIAAQVCDDVGETEIPNASWNDEKFIKCLEVFTSIWPELSRRWPKSQVFDAHSLLQGVDWELAHAADTPKRDAEAATHTETARTVDDDSKEIGAKWFDSPPPYGSVFKQHGPIEATATKLGKWMGQQPRTLKIHNGRAWWIQKITSRRFAIWFQSAERFKAVSRQAVAE